MDLVRLAVSRRTYLFGPPSGSTASPKAGTQFTARLPVTPP